MNIYLYEPRGYSPGYAYRLFSDAVRQLLADEGYKSLDELLTELEDSFLYATYIPGRELHIDDGARVTEIELR